ncbi:MAG: hypothetical protein IKS55_08575 [Oscillospiraceae bacterium]|nr:hypothetical protein [Oscillospiraceae bacterium]
MSDYYGSEEYRPLGAWSYFGLTILYTLPIIGLIFLLIHTFSGKNINRRSFARSRWCRLLVIILSFLIIYGIAVPAGWTTGLSNVFEQYTHQIGTGTSQNYNPSSAYGSYDEIYAEYSLRIKIATPGLISEYNEESAKNTHGIPGLEKISNAKIDKLALIKDEGIDKMAGFMMTKGNEDIETYSDWAAKLTEVYTEEASKIHKAYVNDYLI